MGKTICAIKVNKVISILIYARTLRQWRACIFCMFTHSLQEIANENAREIFFHEIHYPSRCNGHVRLRQINPISIWQKTMRWVPPIQKNRVGVFFKQHETKLAIGFLDYRFSKCHHLSIYYCCFAWKRKLSDLITYPTQLYGLAVMKTRKNYTYTCGLL